MDGRIRLDTWECSTCGSQDVRSDFSVREAQYVSKWNHIAVTFNGGNQVKFYINGSLDSTKYLQDSGINTYNVPLEIGSVEGGGQIKAHMGTFRLSSGVKTSFPYASFRDITSEPTIAAGDLIVPPEQGSPDLVVLSVSTYPNPEGGELVEAVIENQGDLGTKNGFYTDLYIDHLPTGTGDYSGSLRFWVNDPIQPGQTVTLTTLLTSLPSAPLQTLSAAADISGMLYLQTDSSGVVPEPDDLNNIFDTGIPICLTSPDAFEDDSSSGSATVINTGVPQSHNFDKLGDQDWVQFTAQADQLYILRTLDLGISTDTYLSLIHI